ncbi:unnamed protein product, partial [Polarella glacialis]
AQKYLQPPPWGDSWGAAGIVAISGRRSGVQPGFVCLVEKRDGCLGFPKGGAEAEDTCALDTALREWREESNLPEDSLTVVQGSDPIVEGGKCHYFVAAWASESQPLGSAHGGAASCWRVQDDPTDPNPIVLAHWLPLPQAMLHPR